MISDCRSIGARGETGSQSSFNVVLKAGAGCCDTSSCDVQASSAKIIKTGALKEMVRICADGDQPADQVHGYCWFFPWLGNEITRLLPPVLPGKEIA